MTKELIIFLCIGLYICIAFVVYAILNKVSPYNEATDYSGEGDCNKGVALLWPIMLPIILVIFAVSGLVGVMEMIRTWQNGGDDNA